MEKRDKLKQIIQEMVVDNSQAIRKEQLKKVIFTELIQEHNLTPEEKTFLAMKDKERDVREKRNDKAKELEETRKENLGKVDNASQSKLNAKRKQVNKLSRELGEKRKQIRYGT